MGDEGYNSTSVDCLSARAHTTPKHANKFERTLPYSNTRRACYLNPQRYVVRATSRCRQDVLGYNKVINQYLARDAMES